MVLFFQFTLLFAFWTDAMRKFCLPTRFALDGSNRRALVVRIPFYADLAFAGFSFWYLHASILDGLGADCQPDGKVGTKIYSSAIRDIHLVRIKNLTYFGVVYERL